MGSREQKIESGCEKGLILITLMHRMCIIERDGRSLWGYILLILLKVCECRIFQADFLGGQAKPAKVLETSLNCIAFLCVFTKILLG